MKRRGIILNLNGVEIPGIEPGAPITVEAHIEIENSRVSGYLDHLHKVIGVDKGISADIVSIARNEDDDSLANLAAERNEILAALSDLHNAVFDKGLVIFKSHDMATTALRDIGGEHAQRKREIEELRNGEVLSRKTVQIDALLEDNERLRAERDEAVRNRDSRDKVLLDILGPTVNVEQTLRLLYARASKARGLSRRLSEIATRLDCLPVEIESRIEASNIGRGRRIYSRLIVWRELANAAAKACGETSKGVRLSFEDNDKTEVRFLFGKGGYQPVFIDCPDDDKITREEVAQLCAKYWANTKERASNKMDEAPHKHKEREIIHREEGPGFVLGTHEKGVIANVDGDHIEFDHDRAKAFAFAMLRCASEPGGTPIDVRKLKREGHEINIEHVYSGIGIPTPMGHYGICQRDSGIVLMLDDEDVWVSGDMPSSEAREKISQREASLKGVATERFEAWEVVARKTEQNDALAETIRQLRAEQRDDEDRRSLIRRIAIHLGTTTDGIEGALTARHEDNKRKAGLIGKLQTELDRSGPDAPEDRRLIAVIASHIECEPSEVLATAVDNFDCLRHERKGSRELQDALAHEQAAYQGLASYLDQIANAVMPWPQPGNHSTNVDAILKLCRAMGDEVEHSEHLSVRIDAYGAKVAEAERQLDESRKLAGFARESNMKYASALECITKLCGFAGSTRTPTEAVDLVEQLRRSRDAMIDQRNAAGRSLGTIPIVAKIFGCEVEDVVDVACALVENNARAAESLKKSKGSSLSGELEDASRTVIETKRELADYEATLDGIAGALNCPVDAIGGAIVALTNKCVMLLGVNDTLGDLVAAQGRALDSLLKQRT